MCDIQPQVPAQVTSSGKTADKSADSLYHQPATQPIMEEEDQGLEPELISFNQAAAGSEAANSGVNTGMLPNFYCFFISPLEIFIVK